MLSVFGNRQSLGAAYHLLGHTTLMEPWPDRLKRMRAKTGLSQAKVAERLGISPPSVAQWETGRSRPGVDKLPRLARLYGVTLADLCGSDIPLTEAEEVERNLKVPVLGYVGAGTEVFPFDDATLGGGLEHVEAPPGSDDDLGAVIVRGSSMIPAFWEGDLLFYTRDAAFDREECLYQECVVKVLDGPTYVKVIRPGRTSTTFSLESFNAPPIMDVEIEWAAPVLHINRTRRRARAAMEVLAKTKRKRKVG